MQQQFDALQALLVDDCPVVRATGKCHTTLATRHSSLNHHFSRRGGHLPNRQRLLGADSPRRADRFAVHHGPGFGSVRRRPSRVSFLYLTRCSPHSDGTSHSVRLAVVKGFRFLLDNHQAVPFLRKLLPNMRQMIHDPAVAVRAAFVELLLTVKAIRDIKVGLTAISPLFAHLSLLSPFCQFYDVVPVEDLLARLEVDNDQICANIVSVLLSSFFPTKADDATRVQRCVASLSFTAYG